MTFVPALAGTSYDIMSPYPVYARTTIDIVTTVSGLAERSFTL